MANVISVQDSLRSQHLHDERLFAHQMEAYRLGFKGEFFPKEDLEKWDNLGKQTIAAASREGFSDGRAYRMNQ